MKRLSTLRSLHVGYFTVEKRHLQILVDINLLRTQVDDLVRCAKRGFYLIGRLPFFYLLRFRRGRLLLRLSSASTLLVATLLVITIAIAALLSAVALIAAAVIDGKQSGDCILHLGRARVPERSLGELEDHIGLIERRGTGVVTGIATDDADLHLVPAQLSPHPPRTSLSSP